MSGSMPVAPIAVDRGVHVGPGIVLAERLDEDFDAGTGGPVGGGHARRSKCVEVAVQGDAAHAHRSGDLVHGATQEKHALLVERAHRRLLLFAVHLARVRRRRLVRPPRSSDRGRRAVRCRARTPIVRPLRSIGRSPTPASIDTVPAEELDDRLDGAQEIDVLRLESRRRPHCRDPTHPHDTHPGSMSWGLHEHETGA